MHMTPGMCACECVNVHVCAHLLGFVQRGGKYASICINFCFILSRARKAITYSGLTDCLPGNNSGERSDCSPELEQLQNLPKGMPVPTP